MGSLLAGTFKSTKVTLSYFPFMNDCTHQARLLVAFATVLRLYYTTTADINYKGVGYVKGPAEISCTFCDTRTLLSLGSCGEKEYLPNYNLADASLKLSRLQDRQFPLFFIRFFNFNGEMLLNTELAELAKQQEPVFTKCVCKMRLGL